MMASLNFNTWNSLYASISFNWQLCTHTLMYRLNTLTWWNYLTPWFSVSANNQGGFLAFKLFHWYLVLLSWNWGWFIVWIREINLHSFICNFQVTCNFIQKFRYCLTLSAREVLGQLLLSHYKLWWIEVKIMIKWVSRILHLDKWFCKNMRHIKAWNIIWRNVISIPCFEPVLYFIFPSGSQSFIKMMLCCFLTQITKTVPASQD